MMALYCSFYFLVGLIGNVNRSQLRVKLEIAGKPVSKVPDNDLFQWVIGACLFWASFYTMTHL